MDWLTVTGLVLDAIGAIVLCSSLFVSLKGNEDVIRGGRLAWLWPRMVPKTGQDHFLLMQGANIPDRLQTHRRAVVGSLLLFVGFMCQIVAIVG